MYLYNKMARDVSPVAMFLLGKSSIVKKILFVKSLHKMVTPLPLPLISFKKTNTLYKKLPCFIKNYIWPPYKKLQPPNQLLSKPARAGPLLTDRTP